MKTIEKRLENYSACGKSGCWNWNGYIDGSGYGRIYYVSNSEGVHRVSWLVHNGAIPPNMLVLHKCNNRACINPEHLYLSNTRNYKKSDKVRRRVGAKRLGIDISEDMHARLVEIVRRRNCTLSKYIRRIIYKCIKIEEGLK